MKRKSIKIVLLSLFFIVILTVWISITFTGSVMKYSSRQRIQNDINSVTVKADKKRIEQADFNYDNTKALSSSLSSYEAAKSLMDDKTSGGYLAAGTIKIPNIGVNLPIGLGLSKNVLLVGAGTMKREQKMGEGNYVLAGHHMNDQDVLFSPLMRIKKGNIIYLSDTQQKYQYRVTNIIHVDEQQLSVIDDVPGERMITLITCDRAHGKDSRLVVQGKLI
ncbi:class A sortase [Paucilactobacillus kaifaensis]|uniref:class A sortase n=1 Tax=Paucilactobacillus kaifaensis TaxID=2559921 RepID=UPI0010F531C0|nr:class A sortase [Paucilactobacillus kaifaensis]